MRAHLMQAHEHKRVRHAREQQPAVKHGQQDHPRDVEGVSISQTLRCNG